MTRNTVLITGASSGVGLATARGLAQQGAEVLMVCRDRDRGAAAVAAVAAVASGAPPVLLLADLSAQADIRALAADIRGRWQQLDVVVNNAGAAFSRRGVTVDGIERTFAINHLAPFLLTNLLLDQIRAAPAGRIVTVASGLHNGAPEFLDDLQSERRYRSMAAYRHSKLGNILFTYELARRLAGSRVTANCLEPGPTVTRFGAKAGGVLALLMVVVRPIMRSADAAAGDVIYLATSPQVSGKSAGYYSRGRPARSKPITYDRDIAARHWRISEQLTGLA